MSHQRILHLPEALDTALRAKAAEEGYSVSELVRILLCKALGVDYQATKLLARGGTEEDKLQRALKKKAARRRVVLHMAQRQWDLDFAAKTDKQREFQILMSHTAALQENNIRGYHAK